jgi:CHAD domain-containing protein
VAQRHRVRIQAKRLRYAVEGLASILDTHAARRLAARLADLQDALGRANDAATGKRLVRALDPPRAFAAFAGAWLGERMRGDMQQLEQVARRVAAARVPWGV